MSDKFSSYDTYLKSTYNPKETEVNNANRIMKAAESVKDNWQNKYWNSKNTYENSVARSDLIKNTDLPNKMAEIDGHISNARIASQEIASLTWSIHDVQSSQINESYTMNVGSTAAGYDLLSAVATSVTISSNPNTTRDYSIPWHEEDLVAKTANEKAKELIKDEKYIEYQTRINELKNIYITNLT